ncbi:MAG: phosphatidylserine decarboxylase [Endomicrobium sp.]|nr:phosphatidylserine decarboxylase [Endomicrobium sp.]
MRIVKEGYPFVKFFGILGLILLIISYYIKLLIVIGLLFVLLSLLFAWFFRDPEVKITSGNNLIISPCNGTILEISDSGSEKIIRVFLSIFDVHLQRSPVSGKILNVEHKKGKFLKAMSATAHLVNEQNIITIENDNGIYIIKQIAGIIARRCITWVKQGDELKVGDKIGLIKFGSQVDLHMPKNVNIQTKVGQKVVSGYTILAILKTV